MLADLILVFGAVAVIALPVAVLAMIDRFTAWLWRDDDLVEPWEWPHGR